MCFTFLLQRYRCRAVQLRALKTKEITHLQRRVAGDTEVGRAAGASERFH